ncbi:thiol reductant ABC exporter subunit CydC [Acidocella aminolytica]|uniref:ABC transporter cysteine exporter CydCD n=1 Tax=Acidocella aminolytica 101 = DSM 11237 TaxID=1120923 RepID=A0A0D6PEJ6_9PROT|nr:thiol reductant ABC exporter subunit CydC [Acidocella aminolytica]GAN79618.1 ABC transporter cysteine exporter CydCD [Acidocella aminolytica 101 = DSM 11237]GBQ34524.1 ABC-type transport system [Acidocella aminolytica 101 = DSM 11237]SHF06184.1 ATP-binding cassette, subfamily C, CydC [Acidocella aminolytica 101 = DSM 11237]
MSDIWRLVRLLSPRRGWMLAGLGMATVTLLANFGLLALSGWFLAATALTGLAGIAAQNTFNFFTPSAMVRFFATLRVLSRYTERLVTHEATFRLLADLRVWFYTRLEPLAPAALQTQRAADLLNRIVADIDTLNLFYLRVFVPVLTAIAAGLLMAAFFAFFSWPAALALILGLALNGMLAPVLTNRLGAKPGVEITRLTAALRTEYVEALQGMGELLVFGAAPAMQARAAVLNEELATAQAQMGRVAGLGLALSGLAANATLLAVLVFGARRFEAGGIGAAQVPMLVLGAMAAFEATAPLPGALQYLGQIKEAARRIFALADQPPPIAPQEAAAPKPAGYGLSLDNITLRYAPDSPAVLNGLCLTVPEGQHIGIVGATGAGKSTLINLLLRFHEFQGGVARFGGQDLRAFGSADMARHITVISQRSYLFHTTIRDNLLLANGAADEAALWHALDVAQLSDFVRSLPRGLDCLVGEAGSRLSGGQARRIALARAVLKPAPWLILDEPTEGLDTETERAFLADLAPILKGRTVFYITHRPAGLKLMDEVYTLRDGQAFKAA